MPSPELFWETLTAHQRTSVLEGAVELEVFTAIGEGAREAASIAARIQGSVKGTRILCDHLAATGFLIKDGNGYALTEDSAVFLDKRSPAYMGGMVKFMLGATIREAFSNVAGAVRKGGTMLSPRGTVEDDHPVWRDFARAMVPMAVPTAEAISCVVDAASGGPLKVLDVAAGHGIFGITIARHNPAAEIWALDWDAVLDVAREHAQAAGVAERFHPMPGSAFDVEFGTGFDLVLFTNFFHHFSQAGCETLMRKAAAALKPGGRAVTAEFVPNEDRVTPPMAATFAMVMLASTGEGDAYTFAEYERMFANSGFSGSRLVELPRNPQRLIVSTK